MSPPKTDKTHAVNDLRKRVYQAFDVVPLEPHEEDLYVDLDDVRGSAGTRSKLAESIRMAQRPTCHIFAGHRGCGKTTELKRLQGDLEHGSDPCFVVYCKIEEELDENDLDFPDILLAIVRQTAKQLKERRNIKLAPGYFRQRFAELKDVLTREISFDNVDLDAGIVQVTGVLKSSPPTRGKIRRALDEDASNLIAAANDVIGQAKLELIKKGCQNLVIIVDDLDKMVLRPVGADEKTNRGEMLFYHRQSQMRGFYAHMIYTMPIALAYSSVGPALAGHYDAPPSVVPMTRVTERPPKCDPYPPGVEKFRELIQKRLAKAGALESDVFESKDVIDRLIHLSGGQPRELMVLIREAIISGDLPIGETHVFRAAREFRQAYARQMREDHWPIILEVRSDGTLRRIAEREEAVQDLLHNRAILQYKNDDEWYAVNPLVGNPPAPPQSP